MVLVSKHGMMGLIMRENGFMMLLRVMEHISGQMKEYTKVNGKTINYMEGESSIGLMDVHTLETIMMI